MIPYSSYVCKQKILQILKAGLAVAAFLPLLGLAQHSPSSDGSPVGLPDPMPVADTIAVENITADLAIKNRISGILSSSDWFDSLEVSVEGGIVKIYGHTAKASHKDWADQIAGRTQGVVAVVNNLNVIKENAWTLAPAIQESKKLAETIIAGLPMLVLCGVIFLLTLLAARLFFNFSQNILLKRIESNMLRRFVARGLSIPVFLFGIYLILNISGLTKLAVTILGGTGLIGLVIGIAFRDITENFLASILISTQRPFRLGDHIQVLDFNGFVQAVTTRGTVIMTLEGNHVQIPNSIIYKQPITNFSANPNMRLDFAVGIGYDADIAQAQQLALEILNNHPAVLDNPEVLVLAEDLASSTVIMRLYFWINAQDHSGQKIKSSVIRLVKASYMQNGVSMPDDAREIIFPEGIPMMRDCKDGSAVGNEPADAARETARPRSHTVVSAAEGDLTSEASSIRQQAQKTVLGENETNILSKQ